MKEKQWTDFVGACFGLNLDSDLFTPRMHCHEPDLHNSQTGPGLHDVGHPGLMRVP